MREQLINGWSEFWFRMQALSYDVIGRGILNFTEIYTKVHEKQPDVFLWVLCELNVVRVLEANLIVDIHWCYSSEERSRPADNHEHTHSDTKDIDFDRIVFLVIEDLRGPIDSSHL